MLDNILLGLFAYGTFSLWIALFSGAVIGYIIGAIPGLGPTLGVALLIPFTYGMDPLPAIVLLVAIYVAAEYGGAITAIIINTPGTAAAVATSWDGYPMNKQGKAGQALNISIITSGFGIFISSIMLMLTAVPLSNLALKFGPAEYFAISVLGLSLVAGLSSDHPLKGAVAMGLGLMIAFVGLDPQTGVPRFTFSPSFYEGIPLVPVLLGLFALSEALMMVENTRNKKPQNSIVKGILEVPISLYMSMKWLILKSALIGYAAGVIPGAGASIASFLSYGEAKRSSKNPALFGNGSPEGIAASETANNAAVSGSLAPLLALGIPGSATTAVLIGALMIQGVQPGPLLFNNHPEIPYTIFVSLWVGIPIMVMLGLLGSKLWTRVANIRQEIIAASVAGLALIGSYATSNSFFPVYITIVFGILGYLMRKANFPTSPIILALVLGELMENNLRRALVAFQGDWTVFLFKPVSLSLLILSILIFFTPLLKRTKKK